MAVNRVQGIHTHGAANDLLDKTKTAYVTELFSKSDVRRSIEEKIPLSVATPGDSRYNSIGMGEPKIYIFYPDTKEISYFGIPKTYKDKIDENRYKVIRNKNGTVEIKEIRKKTSKSKK